MSAEPFMKPQNEMHRLLANYTDAVRRHSFVQKVVFAQDADLLSVITYVAGRDKANLYKLYDIEVDLLYSLLKSSLRVDFRVLCDSSKEFEGVATAYQRD